MLNFRFWKTVLYKNSKVPFSRSTLLTSQCWRVNYSAHNPYANTHHKVPTLDTALKPHRLLFQGPIDITQRCRPGFLQKPTLADLTDLAQLAILKMERTNICTLCGIFSLLLDWRPPQSARNKGIEFVSVACFISARMCVLLDWIDTLGR